MGSGPRWYHFPSVTSWLLRTDEVRRSRRRRRRKVFPLLHFTSGRPHLERQYILKTRLSVRVNNIQPKDRVPVIPVWSAEEEVFKTCREESLSLDRKLFFFFKPYSQTTPVNRPLLQKRHFISRHCWSTLLGTSFKTTTTLFPVMDTCFFWLSGGRFKMQVSIRRNSLTDVCKSHKEE